MHRGLGLSRVGTLPGLPAKQCGDPFKDGTYGLHTHDFEREVIVWFAELLHAPADDIWGYVTNGGTEGNLYGLYLARELYPDGMVYASQDTHYSVAKNLRLLKMPHIMIKSREDGSIDLEDLRETIRIHRDLPPIIFANIGTTMKEGIDRVDSIRAILDDLAISRRYIHCDAALSGMTLPFIEEAPPFDFSQGIDSISISGHKFIGSPVPCGIVLADKNHVRRIARSIEYVGTLDTTIPGSRNGLSPSFSGMPSSVGAGKVLPSGCGGVWPTRIMRSTGSSRRGSLRGAIRMRSPWCFPVPVRPFWHNGKSRFRAGSATFSSCRTRAVP